MIPYQEVQVQQETEFEEVGPTVDSPDDAQVNGNASNIILRKREYRTARHMALIETQISRRTSGVSTEKASSNTTAEDSSQHKRRSLFENAINVE